MNFSRLASIAFLSVALSACSSSAPFPSGSGGTTSAGKLAGSLDSWHSSLIQNRLPGAGCFKAVYPSTQWMRIACSTPPRLWYPVPPWRRPGIRPANVGDGLDYTADTNPHLISQAIGAFPKVKGVKSVETEGQGQDGLNSYTLQLNSYFFPTAACDSISNCDGWEQFVFENPPGAGDASLFIQDWLIGTKGPLSGCPADEGWEYADGGCVQNSPFGVSIPNVSITDLGQVIETGEAALSGDSVYLSVDKTEYGMQNVQSDGVTDLAAHWMGAEFNVVGNAGGSIADFNSGSRITVSLQADTGLKAKPTCPADTGTTGESNNLFFVPAPKRAVKLEYPSIEFTMDSKVGGTPSCDTRRAL
jgi:hypothetical protein